MALINQVKNLQEQGYDDEQIVQQLKEQGFSPLEISEALEQSKIKTAVNSYSNESVEQMQSLVPEQGEMQPSTLEAPQEAMEGYPVSQEIPEQPVEYTYPPQAQPYYPQYPAYQEYQPAAETITEIAEQIAEEKTSLIKKDLMNIENFKTVTEKNIKDIDERLKKIEEIINKLQASILGKIGNYGQNIEEIKQEMGMMQESFSKALNPLIERARGKGGKESEEKTEKKKRKSSAIEHYLRR